MPAMDTDEPQAGDDDGQTNPAAPEEEQNHTPSKADDALRRFAAEQLAQHLETGASLVERCEALALTSRGDRLGPLNAAARLMHANAHVAQTLAHVALVERRSRSIIERIQPPDPKIAELNSKMQDEETAIRSRLKFYRRMNEHIEQSIRARTGESEEPDSVADLIRRTEEDLERRTNRRAKFDAGQS